VGDIKSEVGLGLFGQSYWAQGPNQPQEGITQYFKFLSETRLKSEFLGLWLAF